MSTGALTYDFERLQISRAGVAVFLGLQQAFRVQQQNDAPRHHHRQRAGGVDHLGARRLAAVEPIDIERAQVRFDELEKLPRKRNLRGFVCAEQQVDRRHLAGGDLLADVGVGSGRQSEGFQNGAHDRARKLAADALERVRFLRKERGRIDEPGGIV